MGWYLSSPSGCEYTCNLDRKVTTFTNIIYMQRLCGRYIYVHLSPVIVVVPHQTLTLVTQRSFYSIVVSNAYCVAFLCWLSSPPWLDWPLWNICVTNDHGYAPLVVVNTSRSFPHSWLVNGFVTRLTRRVPLV